MRIIVLFAVILMSTVHSQAQSFGIKGGVNFSDLKGTDADGLDSYTSFHLGILKEWVIFDNLSLQPELLYSTQGAKVDGAEDKFKLNYLTLPIVLKFYMTDAFSIHAGPQFGLLLGETENLLPIETKTFEYGGALGIEYALSNSFFVQGRYNPGFSEIADDVDIKNSVIQISLGVTF